MTLNLNTPKKISNICKKRKISSSYTYLLVQFTEVEVTANI